MLSFSQLLGRLPDRPTRLALGSGRWLSTEVDSSNMSRFFSVLLISVLLTTAHGRTQNTGGLRGTVTGGAGVAVGDAFVAAVSPAVRASTRTDKHGFFIFASLPPGPISIQVSAIGFVSVSVTVCVQTDTFRTVPIWLSAGGSSATYAPSYNNALQNRLNENITLDLYSLGAC